MRKCKIKPGSWNPSRDGDIGRVISTNECGTACVEFNDGNRMSFCSHEYELIREAFEYVCEICNSTDVVRDATAAFCTETQQWELSGVQDQATCNQCNDDTYLVKKAIDL